MLLSVEGVFELGTLSALHGESEEQALFVFDEDSVVKGIYEEVGVLRLSGFCLSFDFFLICVELIIIG